MVNLRWDGDDFRNSQDSSGSTANLISHSGKLQQGYKHGSLTDGLVAYYPMEKGEGEILHDGSTDKTANLVNNPTWRDTGQVGSDSLEFAGEGSDEYAIASGWKGILGSQNRTVAFWVRVDDISNTPGFFSWGDSSVAGAQFKMRIEDSGGDGVPRLENADGSIAGTTALNDSNFHHVAYVLNGSSLSDAEIYVDGKKENASGAGTAIDTQADIDVTIAAADGGSFDHLNGAMDDVRIYDRALSKPEIQALANLSKPSGIEQTEDKVPSQNQGGVSRYKFNSDVNDSWSSNDGTDNTSISPSYVTGVYGQAKNFDGSDDYVELPRLPNFNDGSSGWTVSVWAKFDSLEQGDNVKNDRLYSITNGYHGPYVILSDGNQWTFRTYDGNTVYDLSSSTPELGKWYHYVFQATDGTSNGKLRLYENAKLKDERSSWEIKSNSGINAIGGNGGNGAMDGHLDDFRIYNTALTPQQVEKLYNLGAYRIPRRSTLQ